MSFRVYLVKAGSNSGQMGSPLNATRRRVVLEGEAFYYSYIVLVREFETQLHNYFIENHWGLKSLELYVPSEASSFSAYTPVKIRIETDVELGYSDQQVLDDAKHLLLNYRTTLGSYLTNVSLKVVNSNVASSAPIVIRVPRVETPLDNSGSNKTFDDILRSFFQGLGISTPVVLIGGVALVLLLRR